MDLKDIKELMTAMERARIKEITIEEKAGSKVHIVRQDEHALHAHHVAAPPVFHPAPVAHSVPHKPHHAEEPREKKEGNYVSSPMVGTVYLAPSPDDAPFVKVGERVEAGTVVCIIEAMKVMNEVKAGFNGTIAEILVENAHPVEFGTKLIRIV